jgi:hypothetical protein
LTHFSGKPVCGQGEKFGFSSCDKDLSVQAEEKSPRKYSQRINGIQAEVKVTPEDCRTGAGKCCQDEVGRRGSAAPSPLNFVALRA